MPEFVIEGGEGICNALRRSLLHDTTSWAPNQLLVRENTSCVTDEYLAHRVGLVPFRKVGEGTTMTLDATGPATVYSHDVAGVAFETAIPGVPIIELGAGQRVAAEIRFDLQRASKHARYSPCAAVAFRADGPGKHRLRFDPVDPQRSCVCLLREAIDAFDARLDAALLKLADERPVHKSFC